ncbi:RNA polymerase sigma factor [Fibrella forsythiae]|uniref:Sigma-70 family RNA polymerase sigma factor n=1 Tax=Fibrella forsythiae TaxID=2817061 RepID=A0ABS3JK66_9BACT|nr:sigma-70 family RNA polymerase sigma factor [Fibrella forsythiae]MBO0949634.1 sigma-70 family RNA polymerase sigma factor [Fibrella forsythiae]
MPSKPIDRSARFYFDRIRALLVGDTKPCARFSTFQELHEAVGNSNELIRNRAFQCLYDRYLKVASSEARRFKLRDEERAAEALDRVFVTMHQRINTGKLRLTDEPHMANYIKLGVRFRLTTYLKKDLQMPLLHADDLQPVLAQAGIQVESELEYMLINEAVERALATLSVTCQQKLLLSRMGLSYDEIASELKIDPKSVKTGVYRCRIELKAELLKLNILIRPNRATGNNTGDSTTSVSGESTSS